MVKLAWAGCREGGIVMTEGAWSRLFTPEEIEQFEAAIKFIRETLHNAANGEAIPAQLARIPDPREAEVE